MRKVEVVPYSAEWPSLYEAEAEVIAAIMGDELVRIHHIGSTAVPGLHAKPIIDMLAEVCDIGSLDKLNGPMIAAGYTPMGEYGIAGRRYYFKGSEKQHTHHLHAFQAGCREVERHLLFRDYLRAHPAEAAKYARIKEALAARFPADIDAYMQGKDAFIKELERKAYAWNSRGHPET